MRLKAPNRLFSERKSVNYSLIANRNSEQLRELITRKYNGTDERVMTSLGRRARGISVAAASPDFDNNDEYMGAMIHKFHLTSPKKSPKKMPSKMSSP